MNVDVDVVVPSAGPLTVVARSLERLARAVDQARLARDRVIVVDDRASRPGLVDLAAARGFQCVPGPGRGPGPARNLGTARGTAPAICFMDDDIMLDASALQALCESLPVAEEVAVVGALRPPRGARPWLVDTYRRATMTPASGLAPPGEIPWVSFATGLAAIDRDLFERAGGFPDMVGIEDSLFGLAAGEQAHRDSSLRRLAGLSGIHEYSPSWNDWLTRNWEGGWRLRRLAADLPRHWREELLGAHGLQGGDRARVKRGLGRLPWPVLRAAKGMFLRHAAAAAAEARGYLGLPGPPSASGGGDGRTGSCSLVEGDGG